jgi:hypothetical protein
MRIVTDEGANAIKEAFGDNCAWLVTPKKEI